MNGQALAEAPQGLQPDPVSAFDTRVVSLRGHEGEGHRDHMVQMHALAVVSDQKPAVAA